MPRSAIMNVKKVAIFGRTHSIVFPVIAIAITDRQLYHAQKVLD